MADGVKAKLRWYQFSLRALLIFVTLFAVACSWFTIKMRQAIAQWKIVETIQSNGGSVYYDSYSSSCQWGCDNTSLWTNFFYNVVSVSLTNDDDIKQIHALTRLREVRLFGLNVSNAGLKLLHEINQIEDLSLIICPNITDAGLENLKELSQLKSLWITEISLTDVRLKYLKELPNLQSLKLIFSGKITDADIDDLKDMTNLQCLTIEDSEITDLGLKQFRGMSQLRMLDLTRSTGQIVFAQSLGGATQKVEIGGNHNITPEGIAELRKELPNCEIIH